MFILLVVSLYTTKVIFNVLGIVDYGIYSAVGGIVVSLSFFSSTLANASQRFFATEIAQNNIDKLKRTFSMMFWIFFFAALIMLLISETLGSWFLLNKMTIPSNRIDAAVWVFQSSILMFIISVITLPFQALIIADERMKIYAYIGIMDGIQKLGIAFTIKYSSFDNLILYAALMFLSSLFSNSIYIIYCLKKYKGFHLSKVYDSQIIKDLFSYSSWTLLGSFSYICNSHGLNLLLNIFFGPQVNAAYAISNQIKSTINQFSSNFFIAVRPALIKGYASNNIEQTKALFYASTKLIFIILFILIMPLSFCIEQVLILWLGKINTYMVDFVRPILFFAIILSISDPITTVIQAANKVKDYSIRVDILTLATLPISYIALKLGCGSTIVFTISIIIFILAHFIRLKLLKTVFPITIKQYYKNILLHILLTVITAFIIIHYVNSFLGSDLLSTIVKLGIDAIICAVSSLLFLLNKAERSMLIKIVKKQY